MRSAVIILVVLAALVAGFAVFMLIEPAPPAVRRVERNVVSTELPPPPSATASTSGPAVGAGQNVWIQQFDKKTGQLVSEFRADRYDPPVDNQVHVVNTTAHFFQKNGSVMAMSAKTGDMVMPEQARKNDRLNDITAQPPSHGVLNEVTIQLYDDVPTMERGGEPSLTCTMPILAFDNDTLSLATIATRLNGQDVLPDRVPVTVRGRDYDFDGTGLKLRYNQRDQHLEYLEIAHGQRLLIKHPKNVSSSPTIGGISPTAMLPVMLDGAPIELADADPAAGQQMSAEEREEHRKKRLAATQTAEERAAERAAQRAADRAAQRAAERAAQRAATRASVATQKASKPPREVVAYHATFSEAVRLKEGNAPIGDADKMVVTFTFEPGHASTQPADDEDADDTDTPTTAPAAAEPKPAAPAAQVTPGPRPMTTEPSEKTAAAPAHRAAKRSSPATAVAANKPAATATASAPAVDEDQPIEVTWTGPLVVVPLKLADSGLKNAGDHIVEFTGRPVHLNRQGSSIESPYVWAGVEGDRFAAKGNDQFPVITLKDEQGLTLKTHNIDSDNDVITVHGDSVATNVIAATGSQPASTMTTKWTDTATLHLITTKVGDRAIDHAKLVGNVDVQHPQLHVTGDSLELGFVPNPNGGQPQISVVSVAGNVNAAVKGDDGQTQTIASKTLDLATAQAADGTVSLKSLHANGDVKAVNAGQTLQTDDLVAQLLPPAAGSANAPSATQPAGVPNAAALDHLVATGNVHFSTPQNQTATADILKVDRRTDAVQDISLIGNPAVVTDPTSKVTGKLIKLDSTGQTASVVGAGTLDGVAHAQGDTTNQQPPRPMNVAWSDSLDYDGAKNHARVSGNVVITSRGDDGSTDKATGQTLDLVLADSSSTTQPATKPAATQQAVAGVIGGGGNKVLKQMTLSNSAGDVEVSSITLDPAHPGQPLRRLDMLAPQVVLTTAADGSVSTMTVPSAGRMLLEDNGKGGATSQPAATQPGGVNAQGRTAIAWSKSLNYDTIARKATLLGDVLVVHQMGDGDSMRLTAPRMTADLEPGQSGQSQIKQVVADQGATFQSSKIRFEADHATYEPAADRVIAAGTERQPVQVFDQSGLSTGSFDELWWNLKTNQPERLKNISVQSRGMH